MRLNSAQNSHWARAHWPQSNRVVCPWHATCWSYQANIWKIYVCCYSKPVPHAVSTPNLYHNAGRRPLGDRGVSGWYCIWYRFWRVIFILYHLYLIDTSFCCIYMYPSIGSVFEEWASDLFSFIYDFFFKVTIISSTHTFFMRRVKA